MKLQTTDAKEVACTVLRCTLNGFGVASARHWRGGIIYIYGHRMYLFEYWSAMFITTILLAVRSGCWVDQFESVRRNNNCVKSPRVYVRNFPADLFAVMHAKLPANLHGNENTLSLYKCICIYAEFSTIILQNLRTLEQQHESTHQS